MQAKTEFFKDIFFTKFDLVCVFDVLRGFVHFYCIHF